VFATTTDIISLGDFEVLALAISLYLSILGSDEVRWEDFVVDSERWDLILAV
jgi:hypothetical protein